ncbi:hypothetical protein [Spirosoma sp.]|uniref:hypothetical protein n=1 Tax=Spirosoma sp. TaxID=1899569 RepID=UPI003B3AF060
MSKKIVLFSLMLISKDLCAQYLKVDIGLTSSRFTNSKNLSILKSRIPNYSLFIGSDYLQHKWYYLSSQFGYNVLGGKDEDVFIQNEKVIVTERLKYLHLNTTFRAYKRSSGLNLFAGVGPYANILVGPKRFKSDLYRDFYEFKPFHLGGKGEIGITQDINKLRLGLVGTYLMSLTPATKSDYLSLNNNAFSITFTAGYHLR